MKKFNIIVLIIVVIGLSYYNFELYQDRQSLAYICQRYNIKCFNLQKEIIDLQKEIETLKQQQQIVVSATAYTACRSECDSTPNKTAILTRPMPGRTIAVSRDLMHLLGKKVYIEGLGVRKVEDLMNPRFTKKIDVLMASKYEARKFGFKRGIRIAPL